MTELRTLERLRWRARRGMKELDVLLARWLDARGASASVRQLEVFERLLAREDADLWPWMLGRSTPEDPELGALVGQIRTVDLA
ncbi:MAG TPA: succinate dehydrogenase assembly factor 2 [Candidatus Saccharimonadia bacterium]|nr:succinate dehydrogenase assembly factor 2 [Candidatus Saccharimonadia bacterium]